MNSLTLTTPLPLDQNPAAVYVASLGSDTGRRSQAQALRVVAQALGGDIASVNWSALRYQHTAAIRSQISQLYAPATANKILSALRQTLKQAWLLGQMSAEDYRRAAELAPIEGKTLPAGRELSVDEIRRLLDTCKLDNLGVRDRAIIALMYTTGMRREEVTSLTVDDYDPETGMLVIRGKRSKERTGYMVNAAKDALDKWLSVRGTTPGALFVRVNKGGNLGTEKLNTATIYQMLEKRGIEAGIRQFSPHDLRRTFVTHLLDAGADITTVSKMAGHANVQTTARYDRRGEEAKREVATLLHIPS
jgi:site-specific recombinase XerD